MFPQIAKRKKKELAVGDQAYREWEEVSKELDHRAKLVLKKIPNSILHDFSKVCRIKSIPEFYANYFIVCSYKHGEEEIGRIFSEQIQKMLTHNSHFHKISQILRDREEILNSIRESLLVVEGFMLMNQGKNIPLSTKGTIEDLVKGCQTLDELRQLERTKTEELAKDIMTMRKNSVQLITGVGDWRKYLQRNSKQENSYVKKIKIIYPHQAVNSLLLLFYDTSFIKLSALRAEISFGKDEEDPFLEKVGKQKKGGQIQTYLSQYLKNDTNDYRQFVTQLQTEIPSDQVEQQKQKEAERQREQERLKAQQIKSQKEKEQKIKAMREEKDKKMKAQRHSSLRKLPAKKQDSAEKEVRYKTSKGTRSEKKIINIDALLKNRSQRKDGGRQQINKEELKIMGVYKKISKPVRGGQMDSSLLSQKEQEIVNQKKLWQKEIKQQQQQKQKIKKILKQTQKRALIQTRQFEEKLKKYEQEVANLKNRIDSAKKGKRNIVSSDNTKRSPGKPKKSINSVYGSSGKEINKGTNAEILQSKLEEETKTKKYLEQQIKELGKEKIKLEKQLEKESSKISKETDMFQKKLQKYQEAIHKLKGESDKNKQIIKELESSKVSEDKKVSDSLRMYTLKEKQDELKKKILDKIAMRENKKQLRQSKIQQFNIKKESKKLRLSRSRSISQRSLSKSREKDLQIVKTKQTIEIVFSSGRRRKKDPPPTKQLAEAEQKLKKLQKERELLQKKLEMSATGKDEKRKVYESKLNQNEVRVDRFKEQLQKERERNGKLEENIKQMRKSINNEFQTRLNQERVRFQREREELLRAIQREKEEKGSKDNVLEQQMKFLKQMERNQNELIGLLNREKNEKKEKQKMLLEQIQRKEELMNQLEIEQIKKTIEKEVRRQLLESEEEEGQDELEFKQRKAQMQEDIERLKGEKDTEINQLDQQNERLKQLIARIKGEEAHLLEAIRQNIDFESQSEVESIKHKTISSHFNREKGDELEEKSKMQVSQELQPPNSSELMEELNKKTMIQYRSQQKKRQDYSDIENSSHYKDKEKIENLVEFYLKSPHDYPGEKSVVIGKEEKKQMAQQLSSKARLIQQFQNQLFSVKDLPQFVPSLKDDAINNHLLNLREAYQDYEADALRRELFPPLQEQIYNEKELSIESEEPPVVTMMDDVRVHQKKFSPKKKEDKKNFLAINRMRLMLLEENRKQQQREIISQQSKKKIQRDLFQRNRKKREEKLALRRERQEEEKQRKRKEIEKSKNQRHSKHSKSKDKREPSGRSEHSKKVTDNKSDISDISKSSSHSRRPIVALGRKGGSEREFSQSEAERQQQAYFDVESKALKEEKEQQKQRQIEEVKPIREEEIEQSMNQQQQQELQKIERALLKSEIKSLQSQVRSYISGEEQFEVYQQFIGEDQIDTYVDQLLQLSSEELKNLNGNSTLKEDLKSYCTVTILVAKTKKGLEIGIGVFHKEYSSGEYVCDYILAHKMADFLNLVFNFSRHIFAGDQAVSKIQYLFDLKYIQDQETMLHFLEFERKCRRLGEVYVKSKSSKERKYVLKRALFEDFDEVEVREGRGIEVKLRMLLFDTVMAQINQGFHNSDNLNHTSLNLILAYYLSQNPEQLSQFRQRAENQLSYREMLVSALLFHKKELTIKNIESGYLSKQASRTELKKIEDELETVGVADVEEVRLDLSEQLPPTVKRCILEVGLEQVRYLIYKPQQAVTRVQSSNSSQTGLFLSLIPKYKVMVVEAEEFMTMSRSNPELTAFFYIKHFIKNIVDVKKEAYERVYLPELAESGKNLFRDASKRYGGSVVLEETLNLGWKASMANSAIFAPKHRDLVIQKPFIVAVLSGAVERAVEGSPICLRVVA